MVDDLEPKTEGISIQQIAGIIRRRRWHFLVPLFFGWLLVWGSSWFLHSVYKSGTTILVEEPTVSKELVPSNVNDNLQDRLQSIQQQIQSRTRLIHIIDSLNLYPEQRARGVAPDDLVVRMRKDIDIELVRAPGSEQLSSFNVSFSARDPQTAQRVTGELTNLFINENLKIQTEQAGDTTDFFENHLEEARKNLAEQEEKIRVFKDQHVADLPGQLQSNLAILTGLQSQLQTTEDNLNRAKQQSVYYQSLIGQYRTLQRSPRGSVTVAGAPSASDQDLEKLKAQLADLSAHYTDRHPDVRKLKEQIAETEKIRDQMAAGVKTTSGSSSSNTAPATAGDISLAELQSQLQANQTEISNRERSITALQAKINEYQGRLGQEPIREQQLADLSRGYEQSKANYDDLLKKKNASALSTDLTKREQGEHFRMIDPPSLPLKPDFPNHLKLCGVGFAVGLVLGGALAGGTEFMDDRIHNEKEFKELVPLTVISEIPAVTTADEEVRRIKSNRLAWAAASLVFASILAGSALSYFRG